MSSSVVLYSGRYSQATCQGSAHGTSGSRKCCDSVIAQERQLGCPKTSGSWRKCVPMSTAQIGQPRPSEKMWPLGLLIVLGEPGGSAADDVP